MNQGKHLFETILFIQNQYIIPVEESAFIEKYMQIYQENNSEVDPSG